MKRSAWKIPYISSTFFQNRFKKPHVRKLKIRYSCIPSVFTKKRVKVYNGKYYKSIDISLDMRKHKFGEYSWSKHAEGQIRKKGKSKKKSTKKK